MTPPDWSALYTSEVTPAMERFAAPPPMGLLAALALLAAIGIGLLVFATGNLRFAGLVPLGTVGFVLWMTVGQPSRVGEPARYRVGTVTALEQQKRVESTTTTMDRPRIVYSVQLQVTEAGTFDASGATADAAVDPAEERLFVDESLFEQLEEGQQTTLISYPESFGAVAFAIDPDGTVRR